MDLEICNILLVYYCVVIKICGRLLQWGKCIIYCMCCMCCSII